MEPKTKRRKNPRYTTKTLEQLRKNGCVVDVCERWIPNPKHPGGGFRRDLFGLFDVVALMAGKIVGIQSTSIACRAEHLKKMLSPELKLQLAAWCNAGGGVELWAWEKKKNRWQPRIQRIEWQPCGPVEESKILASVAEEVTESEDARAERIASVRLGKYGNCADCDCPFEDLSARYDWQKPGRAGLESVCVTCNSIRLGVVV